MFWIFIGFFFVRKDYLGFLIAVCKAISGKKITDVKNVSSEAKAVINLIDQLSSFDDDIELEEQQQRFGNKAFRKWHERLIEVR